MNRPFARWITLLALGTAFIVQARAQEEESSRKKAPSRAAIEARNRDRQKKNKARIKADAEAKAKAVHINQASKEALMKLPGVTAAYADAIIAKRPYNTKADLVVKGAIPEDLFLSLSKQVTAK